MRKDEVLTEEEVRTILYYSVDIDDCALPLKQKYIEEELALAAGRFSTWSGFKMFVYKTMVRNINLKIRSKL